MVDPFLQFCLDAPIDNAERANRLWLPKGRRPADNRTKEQKDADSADARLRASRNKERANEKREQLIDYYAATSLSVEVIAKHVGMKVDEVSEALKSRGRLK